MINEVTTAPATKRANTLQNTFWYNGAFINMLVTGEQTDGQYAQLEITMQPGIEPPLHTHTLEDETFYLLEGSVQFNIGGQEFIAKPGDYVQMPKNIPHAFKVLTPTAKAVMTIAPAGFENYFCHPKMSVPAPYLMLPPAPQGPPSMEQIELVMAISEEFGIKF